MGKGGILTNRGGVFAPGGGKDNGAMSDFITYRLFIRVKRPVRLTVGRLGTFSFPAGRYVYTGSARRNLEARVARHLRKDKPLRWHIDYLLASPHATVERVERSTEAECVLNRQGGGTVPVPGFGASDCTAGCGAHLRYLGA